jgi:hypothetical protein
MSECETRFLSRFALVHDHFILGFASLRQRELGKNRRTTRFELTRANKITGIAGSFDLGRWDSFHWDSVVQPSPNSIKSSSWEKKNW